jgi:hypothetical protein
MLLTKKENEGGDEVCCSIKTTFRLTRTVFSWLLLINTWAIQKKKSWTGPDNPDKKEPEGEVGILLFKNLRIFFCMKITT